MLDLDMTPYAAFVWPAWAVSALVLTALTARPCCIASVATDDGRPTTTT